jgi:hypothetical protein
MITERLLDIGCNILQRVCDVVMDGDDDVMRLIESTNDFCMQLQRNHASHVHPSVNLKVSTQLIPHRLTNCLGIAEDQTGSEEADRESS